MKTTKYIASFMYFMVLLCFIFSTIFFIFRISNKIINQDEINSSNIKSNYKNLRINGNLVPVNLASTSSEKLKLGAAIFTSPFPKIETIEA